MRSLLGRARSRALDLMSWTPNPLRSPPGAMVRSRAAPGCRATSRSRIRALILGALAVGETRIGGLLEGEDVLNTAQALRALGAAIERRGGGAWRVHGVGVGGFAEPPAALDFGNSGTGCRLMLGAVAGCPITATFDGDASLRSRPMRRVLDPLERIGARTLQSADGRLPLTIAGARDPIPIVFEPPVAVGAAQIGGAAGRPAAPGETTVIEREATRTTPRRCSRHFGAEVRVAPEGSAAAASRCAASRSWCRRRSSSRPTRPRRPSRWSRR